MTRAIRQVSILAVYIGLSIFCNPGNGGAQVVLGSPFLQWRNIGPASIGGAVTDVEGVHTSNGQVKLYVSAVGGLFESDDEGTHWNALLDQFNGSAAVNSIAVSPWDSNELWIATGDPTPEFRAIPGDGIYRSLDAGKHWKSVGFSHDPYISFVRFDPRNRDTIYVGVMGDFALDAPGKGLYRSIDGGQTWQRVLAGNGWTGAVDIAFDPSHSSIVYAVMQQLAATRGSYMDYGPGSGIFKSTDGGATWRVLTDGLPQTFFGRCAVAVAPSMPGRIYAVVDSVPPMKSPKGPSLRGVWLYRSDDFGEHWQRGARLHLSSFTYSGYIYVDPRNAERVYVLTHVPSVVISDDGGKTLSGVSTTIANELTAEEEYNNGPDGHALWIDPATPSHLVLGNDHGIYFSYTSGSTWKHVENLTLARVYGLGLDTQLPFTHVVAAMQDSFAFMGVLRSANLQGITNDDWRPLRVGSETGNAAVDLKDQNFVYVYGAGLGADYIQRADVREEEGVSVGPGINFGFEDLLDSRPGTLLFTQRPVPTLYYGATRIYRSTNHGTTWKVLSPVISEGKPPTETPMGFPARSVDSFAKRWMWDATITAIAPSPLQPSLLYTGTHSGTLAVTHDTGQHWRRLQLPQALRGAEVTGIAASRFQLARVYVSLTRFFDGDRRPYILVSNDYGAHWRAISPRNADGATVWAILEHPAHPGVLFAATDRGVIGTTNDGASWYRVGFGLPNIRVTALALERQSNDLVAGTWGRGIWVLDDITPLTTPISSACPRLFPVRHAFVYLAKGWTYYEAPTFTSPNPLAGAILTYYLPKTNDAARTHITIQIRNAHGVIVRNLEQWYQPGLNRLSWDLRLPPLWEGGMGPFVFPGQYSVQLHAPMGAACGAPIEESVVISVAPEGRERDFRNSYWERLRAYTLEGSIYRIGDALKLFRNYAREYHITTMQGPLDSIQGALLGLDTGQPGEGPFPAAVLVGEMRSELDNIGNYAGTLGGLMPVELHLLKQMEQTVQLSRRRLATLIAHQEAEIAAHPKNARNRRMERDLQALRRALR